MDETGRNSVTPWTTPSSAAAESVKRRTNVYDARALRWVLTAGATAAAARAPRQSSRRVGGRARRRRAAPEADDRRGDEHARIGAGDDADHHREREAVQHLAAEEEQRERGQQRRARGDDRPAQRLVDRGVDDVSHRVAAHRPQVLADPVEDDDGVVGRVAGHRQNRGDDVQASCRTGRTRGTRA